MTGSPATARAPGERFFAHPRRAVAAGAVLVALVAVAALLVPAGPLAIDRAWAEAMRDLATPGLRHLALVFGWLGRGLGRGLTLAAVGLLLLRARRPLALAAFALAETVTPLLELLLKALVGRPRPPGAAIHTAGSSFPSGHAAYAGATSVALVLLFTAPGGRRRWWIPAALATAGMAWSRTYLEVHWLSDVVAGSILGVGVSFLVFAAAQQRRRAASRVGAARDGGAVRAVAP